MFSLFAPKRRPSVSDEELVGRVPPGQKVTTRWPVHHAGVVPEFDEEEWTLGFFGLVSEEKVLSWQEFNLLPRTRTISDVHCVTGWSRLDNEWEGVLSRELLQHVDVLPEAKHVLVHGEHGYSANMPLEVLLDDAVIFATGHNGRELTPGHGYPVRLVVPGLYFWKSVKWVRGIEFLEKDQRGFWESRGYHNEADPWKEQRYRA